MSFWKRLKPSQNHSVSADLAQSDHWDLQHDQHQQYHEQPRQDQQQQQQQQALSGNNFHVLGPSQTQKIAREAGAVPDRTALKDSLLFGPDSPEPVAQELEASPVSPGGSFPSPGRIAETPEGLLIAKAVANSSAIHNDRPLNPYNRSAQAFEDQDSEAEHQESESDDYTLGPATTQMSGPGYAASKASTDSGQSTHHYDRGSLRRLQRLMTEQIFREQRSGQPSTLSQSASQDLQSPNGYNIVMPQPSLQQGGQQYSTPATHTSPNSLHSQNFNVSSATSQPSTDNSRSPASANQYLSRQDNSALSHALPAHQGQGYSPPDSAPQYQIQSHASLPSTLQQSRSFTSDSAMSTSNNQTLQSRSNRQSMHNGVSGVSPGSQLSHQQQGSQLQAVPPLPTHTSDRDHSRGTGRVTPQPQTMGDELTGEESQQLQRDYKELREKYTKVKKYYFEKEDQVKQLQNSLAHQRLAQSRTSLDDSEYATRFNRLDGLIAQLAFSIRKNWRTIPTWLAGSINKDAIATGKQEMIAAGRAFISCWLVEEVFDKYFHPDLDVNFSTNLKNIQSNIRKSAPPCNTNEEEDVLTTKVVSWRLATLDGLQEMLRSQSSPNNRMKLMEMLKEHLIGALQVNLDNPPMSDLEGGVNMIIELAVTMATHLPLESRDVQIEYFMPGTIVSSDMMKQESGIPALGTSVQEDAAERTSYIFNPDSDVSGAGGIERYQQQQDSKLSSPSSSFQTQPAGDPSSPFRTRKRDMLSPITGSKKNTATQGKQAAASTSSNSLGRPESSAGKEDITRVRMAVGIGAQVRGKTVLVKAPVFST